MQIMKVSKKEFVGYLVTAGFAWFLGTAILWNSGPIMLGVVAKPITTTESQVLYRIKGYSVLPCEFVGHQAKASYTNMHGGLAWHDTESKGIDTDSFSSSPIWGGAFKKWVWDVTLPRETNSLLIIATHDCRGVIRDTGIRINN